MPTTRKDTAAARAAASKPARANKVRRLISRRELLDRIPLSYATIWKLMQRGEFPRSRAVGTKCLWFEDEVDAWIDKLAKVPLKGDAEAAS